MPIIRVVGNMGESFTRSPPKPQPTSAKRIFGAAAAAGEGKKEGKCWA